MGGDGRPSIGDDVTVGHMCVLHGCTLEDGCFVGMKAVVLDGAVVESGAMVAAGALVTPGKRVKKGELWAGSPARKLRDLGPDDLALIERLPGRYAALGAEYRARLGRRPARSIATPERTMKRRWIAVLGALLMIWSEHGALAMDVRIAGNQLILSGSVEKGDYPRVKAALDENPSVDTVIFEDRFAGRRCPDGLRAGRTVPRAHAAHRPIRLLPLVVFAAVSGRATSRRA